MSDTPAKDTVASDTVKNDAVKSDMVKLTINGREVEAAKGEMIISAAFRAGIYVPHFCWHPGLQPDGNCRMCLGSVEGQRKPLVTCKTPVAEGMVVDTHSQEAAEARKGVMEFLLINHPLDCPVCDQAGECVLQDYSHAYGRGHGRFVEDKNLKHIKTFGPRVKFWGTRCIVCTRCVRFTQEVSGTGALTTVNRGDRNVIDIFPGIALDDELSGNTVDVCPVGALVSSEFLFSDRWWHMTRKNTLCTLCSKGCNTLVEHTNGEVRRVRPRPNAQVNGYWMCDHGREDPGNYLTPERLRRSFTGKGADRKPVPTGEAVRAAAQGLLAVLKAHGPGSVAGVTTALNSCEELYLFGKLMDRLGADVRAAWGRTPWEARQYPGFDIPACRDPNTPGVKLFLGESAFDLAALREGVAAGRIKAVFAMSGVPGEDPAPELLSALQGAEFLVVQDVRRTPLSETADVLLAGAGPFETDGTYINHRGRLQRARAVVEPPGYADTDLNLLQGLIAAIDAIDAIDDRAASAPTPLSAQAQFDALAAEVPAFAGRAGQRLSYTALGDTGVVLEAVSVEEAPHVVA